MFWFLLLTVHAFEDYNQYSFHVNNILKVNNGWIDCPDWSYKSPTTLTYNHVHTSNKLHKGSLFATNNINNMLNITARCITLKVPLDHDNITNNKTIDYFITRIYNQDNINTNKVHGSFWMLAGGPGDDGLYFYADATPFLNYINSTYDIYIPTHRGTGYSSPLNCPITFNTSECVNYLDDIYADDIHHYSTYSASMDLGYVIELFKNNMTVYIQNNGVNNTIIYALSYGTYYINQYLLLFPNQSSGVILDGICPPDICRFLIYDNGTNNIGIEFINWCNDDEFCASKFPNTTAYDVMVQLFDTFDDGIVTCIEQEYELTVKQLKAIFYWVLQLFHERIFIPSILYRLNRCNRNDMIALNNFSKYFKDLLFDNDNWTQNMTEMMFENIGLSEMYYGTNSTEIPPLSVEQLVNLSNSYYITIDLSLEMRQEWDIWNKYKPNPSIYNKYANPAIPMLLLNGDIDHQTPLYEAIFAAYGYNTSINTVDGINGNKRYFIIVPKAPHSVFDRTPLKNDSSKTCGFEMVKTFIDPSNDFIPDISCIDWIQDIDWKGDSDKMKQLSQLFYGTNDVWGDQIHDESTALQLWMIILIVIASLIVSLLGIILLKYCYNKCKSNQNESLLAKDTKQQVAMYSNTT
eukprot:412523_1